MKGFLIIVSVVFALVFSSCGTPKSASTVEKYLKAEKDSDYTAMYSLLSQSDKSVKTLQDFTAEKTEEFGLLFTPSVRKSEVFKILCSEGVGYKCGKSLLYNAVFHQWRKKRLDFFFMLVELRI